MKMTRIEVTYPIIPQPMLFLFLFSLYASPWSIKCLFMIIITT